MDVFDAIRTILAVKQYQDKPVPPEVIGRVVEAGRLTASSINLQPWHFVVVTDPDLLKRIGGMARTGPYIAQAAFAVVVLVDMSNQFAVSDGSRAVQSMVLTAWEDGVASSWTGFLNQNDVRPLLGIPDSLDVLAIVPFGYPVKAIGKGKKKRKPLSEVASLNKFGAPFTLPGGK